MKKLIFLKIKDITKRKLAKALKRESNLQKAKLAKEKATKEYEAAEQKRAEAENDYFVMV